MRRPEYGISDKYRLPRLFVLKQITPKGAARQEKRKKMKKLVLSLVCALCAMCAFAQNNLQDVVYLKNGSVVRGTIIEQVPGVSLKVSTADGSVFVYDMKDVEKMTKEEAVARRGSGASQSFFSAGGGEKSPVAAGIFSFIIPGAGQFYNGESKKGWNHLAVWGGSYLLTIIGYRIMAGGAYDYVYNDDETQYVVGLIMTGTGALINLINGISSISDAVKSAKRINFENGYVLFDCGNEVSAGFSPMIAYEHPDFSLGMKNEFNAGMKFKITF